ncbi:oligosaccharide flippase family protein [Amycolatopsis sp. VS8301801F10]|uniref:oligosaccharide flippase family protein n=1 Tax=Amycolatopsis sp. VS8301801F10 TaxID=2652442 RepID=UPI0038FC7B8B
MSSGLGTRAVRGSLWLGAANLVSKSSQMLVTLVLAAVLAEAQLGAIALAVSLVNLGQVVQSIGVYDVISRTGRDPRRMAGTMLTMSAAAGVLLAAALVAAAGPITALLGTPGAAGLVRLAAVGLPFSAVGGVQMGLMHRELDFRRRLLPDGGSAVLGAVVTIALALSGVGPAALVIGLVCTAVAQPLLGALAGGAVRPRWDAAAAAEAVRWIAVVGPAAVVGALLVNLDYLAVGHVLGPAAVGVYSLAYRLAWVPYIMVAVVLGAVAFPLLARLWREGAPLAETVTRFTRAVLVVTGGLYLALAVLSDRIVLLGARWSDSAGPLLLLAGYGMGLCLLQIWYQAVKATGNARRYLALESTHLALLTVGLALFVHKGIDAVAAVQFGAVWLVVPLAWAAMRNHGVAPSSAELAGMVLRVLAAGAVSAVPMLALDHAGVFGAGDSLTGAVAEAVLLVAGYAGATLLLQRGELAALRRGGYR